MFYGVTKTITMFHSKLMQILVFIIALQGKLFNYYAQRTSEARVNPEDKTGLAAGAGVGGAVVVVLIIIGVIVFIRYRLNNRVDVGLFFPISYIHNLNVNPNSISSKRTIRHRVSSGKSKYVGFFCFVFFFVHNNSEIRLLLVCKSYEQGSF